MTTSSSSAGLPWDSHLRPDQIDGDLADTLLAIPGYSSIATAGDCRFNRDAAAAAVGFFHDHLRHVEGAVAGQPFDLQPWQRAWLANLVGWKRKDEQGRVVRRYRETLLYVPRKNGKTPLAAGLALLILLCDGELGQQDYVAAGEREQAALLFRHCRGMVEQSPRLSKLVKIFGGTAAAGQSKSLVRERDGSFLRVVSADASTKHGGNTHLALIDELHVQPDRDLVDVLRTSTASANRPQPLLIYLTTADFARPSICNEIYERACKVRDGTLPDSSFLPVIYEASQSDPWDSEEVWARANPNLGVSVSLDYLRRECQTAKEVPAYENTFRRLHLNQRTETDVRAIPMEQWDACRCPGQPITNAASWQSWQKQWEGRECYAGLDLASTNDVASLTLVFPDEEGQVGVVPFFWVPQEGARKRERRDRVPYESWGKLGLIDLTPGNSIDYDRIRQEINAVRDRFDLREIAVDRWNASHLVTQLQGDGFEVIYFGQGFASMTSPTKELLRLVADGKLLHGGHPVLRWMASNLATETDAAANLKPSKKKSTEKIDGMVAAIMGLGRAQLRDADAGPSIIIL